LRYYNPQQFMDDCRSIVRHYGSIKRVGLFTVESYALSNPRVVISITLTGISLRWGAYTIDMNIQNAPVMVPTVPASIKTQILQLVVDMEELV